MYVFREENKVRSEKIDYDQKMEKYDEAIASHRAKVEHWKREMKKIKLQETDGNPAPELKLLTEEEMDDIRVDTFQNKISRTEAELGKMSPNLQVKFKYFHIHFGPVKIRQCFRIIGYCRLPKERRSLLVASCRI